jgi:hypothetical protein
MKRSAAHTATQQQSNTATHAHYRHTAAHGNQRATYTRTSKHTRAQTQTARQAPPSTTARQHHGPCHPQQRTPASHARHTAHIIQAHKHTRPARPHDVPHSNINCDLRKHHCTHTATRTPHARHAQHGPQPRARHRNHTQSHTRPPRHTHNSLVRLPSIDGMLPESWLLFKSNPLQDMNSHRVILWHPTPPAIPASRP